jgi:GNAT superfamily N-acetyltransferase
MGLGTKFVELNKVIHDRAVFDCGEIELNLFLQEQASKHMQVGISKTMVLTDTTSPIDNKYPICAFYTIAPSSIKRETLPKKLAKKLPYYPVPVFLIAQLAVNSDYQGKGLGKITLIKALEHLWQINAQMAAYAIIVDCLNNNVKQFYKKYGFETLYEYNRTSRMFIPMKVIGKLFA